MSTNASPSTLLVALAGLPGTGKSTLARALAARIGGVVLDKDIVRAALFGPDHVAYDHEQDDICFRAVLEGAAHLLRTDRASVVFVDGRTFSRRTQVEDLEQFARAQALTLRIIECVANEDTVRTRLESDAATGAHPARNRDFGLYQRLALDAEEIVLEDERDRLVVHTDRGSLDDSLATSCAWLQER